VVRAPIFLLLLSSLASAGTQFSTYLGGKFAEYISAVVTDSAGNIYATGQTGSPDFPVTPGTAQTTIGGGSDAFVAKFSPDGALIWCTYFGGSADEGARGIGVDSAGNVIIAGQTDSLNLPTVNALQPQLDNGHLRYGLDAFVAKVSADGSHFIYATYLGGNGNDYAWAVTSDPAGNAYVTGYSGPIEFFPGPDGPINASGPLSTFVVKISPAGRVVFTTFLANINPRAIAVDRDSNVYLAGSGSAAGPLNLLPGSGAVVSKLSADGGREIFRSAIGGSNLDIASGIAIDSSGSAWIAGMTASGDFPLVRPLETKFGARSLWRSTDSTATWTSNDNTPFGQISATLAEMGALYVASSDSGLWVTADGGATWSRRGSGLPAATVRALLGDPASGNLFAGAGGSIFQSADNGATWMKIFTVQTAGANITLLAADVAHPGTLYATGDHLYKSTDGGASWNSVTALSAACPSCTQALAVDPATGNVFTASQPFFFPCFLCSSIPPPKSPLYRSTDGGATWKNDNNVFSGIGSFLIDTSTQPSTIYAGLVARSDDGGQTWITLGTPAGLALTKPVLDPSTGMLYAVSTYPATNLYISRDRGATWQTAPGTPFTGSPGVIPQIGALVADPTAPGAFYVTTSGFHTAAFVARLSPDGAAWLFSTYLGGHAVFDPAQAAGGGIIYSSLGFVNGAAYAEGIALDADGNVVVAGGTRSTDFPTSNAPQPANAGGLDSFITVFSPDASAILYSTYFGGADNDAARALAIDATGAIVIAGQTYSADFPIVNAAQSKRTDYGDAFLAKLNWRTR
jgi:photosystem II stability/assembly factor-like uncharacterized protein